MTAELGSASGIAHAAGVMLYCYVRVHCKNLPLPSSHILRWARSSPSDAPHHTAPALSPQALPATQRLHGPLCAAGCGARARVVVRTGACALQPGPLALYIWPIGCLEPPAACGRMRQGPAAPALGPLLHSTPPVRRGGNCHVR